MSKSVLISIKPKWCELIANGKKTVEVRKNRPKLETPFKCYIYCTNDRSNLWILRESFRKFHGGKIASLCNAKDVGGATKVNGKVIGEFVCDWITGVKCDNAAQAAYNRKQNTCLTDEEIMQYANNGKLYYWYISDLVIYDKPRALSEFKGLRNTKFGYEPVEIKRPPQSWCYVEEDTENA